MGLSGWLHQPNKGALEEEGPRRAQSQPGVCFCLVKYGRSQLFLQLFSLWAFLCVHGDVAQEVSVVIGGFPVRSYPGRVEVSPSETPNPQSVPTSWLVPCMAANQSPLVCECVCE